MWLVCATDGEAATVDAELLQGYDSTAELRSAELQCAAMALGLRGVERLGYRDSGMAGSADNGHPDSLYQAPMDKVVRDVVASIRRHRPQVVICDNRFGGYGHPDHIKMHQATVQAFAKANVLECDPDAGPPFQPRHLYFTAFTLGLLKVLIRLMPLIGRDPRKFGRNRDIDLVQMIDWETPVHVRLDIRPHLDAKLRASACHRSQSGPAQDARGILGLVARWFQGFETFTQGYPEPQPGAKPRRDLFA